MARGAAQRLRRTARAIAARMPADHPRLSHRAHRQRPAGAPVPVHRRPASTAQPAALWAPFAVTALPASQRSFSVRLGALVRKDFLLLTRDYHALAVLFLMPALFFLPMSIALS